MKSVLYPSGQIPGIDGDRDMIDRRQRIQIDRRGENIVQINPQRMMRQRIIAGKAERRIISRRRTRIVIEEVTHTPL